MGSVTLNTRAERRKLLHKNTQTQDHEDNVLNKFRIWKERHNYSDEGKPCQSPGRMKNSSYYIAPVGVRTHDLPHTVASNMGKVSHALTHSIVAIFLWTVPCLITFIRS